MMLDSGKRISASKVKVGDKLKTIADDLEVTSVECVPYNGKVYNFSFENETDANYIIADGFYSGDIYAQNEKESSKIDISEKARNLAASFKDYVDKTFTEKHGEIIVSC